MEKISRRKFLKGSAIVGAGALLMVYSDGSYRLAMAQEAPAFRMRVLHSNDHHARIEPVANSDGTPLHGGVSRRKALIDSIRSAETLPILLVDAGDLSQGTLYYNRFDGQADLEFYNAMGYEAMAIGNHEFDKTQEVLANIISRARFPVISANIVASAPSPLAGKIQPTTIIDKGGQKIGIFSVSPEDTAEISTGARDNIAFTSAIEASRQAVASLQSQGVNFIIGLTHVGIMVDREIARQVAGISLIIGGHSHTPMGPMNKVGTPPYPELIAGPNGRGVPVFQDWEWGRWLGDFTVSFDATGKVIDIQGNPTEVAGKLPVDQGFENRIAVFKTDIDALTKRVVGEAAVVLNGERSDVRSKETNLGDLIAQVMLDKGRDGGAQIAITNGGGIRASIKAGKVTVGDVLTVLPFGNTLALTTITGAQLKDALENGVSQVESGAGRFPQIAGFSFTYDPALPAKSRVTSIAYNGAAVDPNGAYRVATNNFMLTGGDGYTAFAAGSNKIDTGLILSDIVEQYIAANSPVNATTDGRIAVGAGAALPAPAPGTPSPAAPVPATLPNTGGPLLPLGWLASLGASAIAGGMALRRRSQAEAAAEDVELVETEG